LGVVFFEVSKYRRIVLKWNKMCCGVKSILYKGPKRYKAIHVISFIRKRREINDMEGMIRFFETPALSWTFKTLQ